VIFYYVTFPNPNLNPSHNPNLNPSHLIVVHLLKYTIYEMDTYSANLFDDIQYQKYDGLLRFQKKDYNPVFVFIYLP